MQSQYNVQAHVRIFSAACVESLQILGRWSRVGGQALYAALTDSGAQATYRLAWFLTRELSILAWLIAVFCITLLMEQMDSFVQAKLQEPVLTLDTDPNLDLTLDNDPDLDWAVQELWALDTSESDTTEPDPWEEPTVIALPPVPFTLPAPCSPAPLLLLPPAQEQPAVPTAGKARRKNPGASQPKAAKLNIRELRKLAAAAGHKGTARWSKAQCLEALGQEVLTA